MSDIIKERSGSILHIQLNRPEKKNAMTMRKDFRNIGALRHEHNRQ